MTQQPKKRLNVAVFDVDAKMERFFRVHLSSQNFFVRYFRRPLRKSDAALLQTASILVISVQSTVLQNFVSALPNLRCIATCSTGYDHIDLKTCAKRNIAVANVPSYGENTVAEFTFALLLGVMRRIPMAIDQTQDRNIIEQQLCGLDLAGKTIGIIGCGKIGINVVRIANGFGMRVLAYDPYQKASALKRNNARPASLVGLIKKSDIITLHVPLVAATKHLLSGKQFRQMKKGVVIINTARGGLIDTDALLKALQNNTVRYAGLDVIEGEEIFIRNGNTPVSQHSSDRISALLRNKHVLITPHIAYNTQEAIERICQTTVENISAFAEGKPANLVQLQKH